MSDIEIEIDGQLLKAKPNSMVIQVADEAGIYIPRFCYHKHLSIAANCRMCLVEVEKAPKPLPACATPVMPGMKIFTKSSKAIAAQKSVMEFLLINHPLDCPICDQGGECELQDLSLGYGSADSYYTFGKRSVADKNIGPLISTEMTRCIQCTRCIRFGTEIAGMSELGATDRGENMEVGTYIEKAMQSEVSGNVIDLCPVGALTSKPFRFTARAWELNQYPTIAAHDCIGSNIYAHTRSGKVMRVVPHENQAINQTWISDRDRFSYEGLYHADRLEKPMIRVEGKWQETDWQTALEITVAGLRNIIQQSGARELAALASPNSTLEEFYLLQKLMRQLGSDNIDHRLRQTDFSDQETMPAIPGLNASLSEIESADVIVLIGSDIQKEQPIAGLRVRQATLKGARVVAMNMMDYSFNFSVSEKAIAAPHEFVATLAGIAKALVGECAELTNVTVNDEHRSIAKLLREGKNIWILVGIQGFNHPDAAQIRTLALMINNACVSATLGFLTEGANAAGAWLAGAIPHRTVATKPVEQIGFDANTMWKNPRKSYVLLNVEPEFDCADFLTAQYALEQAEFVVALTLYKNPTLMQCANVLLPIASFAETAGTFVNVTGEWQTFNGIATPIGEARPAWKVFRVLGNLFDLAGFDYQTAHEISAEVKTFIEMNANKYSVNRPKAKLNLKTTQHKLSRVGDIPIYAGDSLQRRAKALQETQAIIETHIAAAHFNAKTARQLNIKGTDAVLATQGNSRVMLPVVLDERVPFNAVYIAGGVLVTNQLNELYGPIEIQKI